jgi:thiol peroxidase
MATITHRGNEIITAGTLPESGKPVPNFRLTKSDLTDVTPKELAGKKVVLNIFPSIDTGVCAASVRRFNQLASALDNTLVLCVSKDLPFAHNRFCGAEGIENVHMSSQYKDTSFSDAMGVDIVSGPLAGLMSRAIVVLDENGMVKYTEQVPEIGSEPDYEKAIEALM